MTEIYYLYTLYAQKNPKKITNAKCFSRFVKVSDQHYQIYFDYLRIPKNQDIHINLEYTPIHKRYFEKRVSFIRGDKEINVGDTIYIYMVFLIFYPIN